MCCVREGRKRWEENLEIYKVERETCLKDMFKEMFLNFIHNSKTLIKLKKAEN